MGVSVVAEQTCARLMVRPRFGLVSSAAFTRELIGYHFNQRKLAVTYDIIVIHELYFILRLPSLSGFQSGENCVRGWHFC